MSQPQIRNPLPADWEDIPADWLEEEDQRRHFEEATTGYRRPTGSRPLTVSHSPALQTIQEQIFRLTEEERRELLLDYSPADAAAIERALDEPEDDRPTGPVASGSRSARRTTGIFQEFLFNEFKS